MRKWFKYITETSVDSKYSSVCYGQYLKCLKEHLLPEAEVLSVGSGQGIIEGQLIKQGYKITCSDIEISADVRVPTVEYDVSTKQFSRHFDSIISLSVFFQLNRSTLETVFSNISSSLKTDGQLIFDVGGAEDNFFTWLIDDIICPLEACLIRLKHTVPKRHHGYRYRDSEIVDIACSYNFTLAGVYYTDTVSEINRSFLLMKMLNYPILGNIIKRIGLRVPYVRLFIFKKGIIGNGKEVKEFTNIH